MIKIITGDSAVFNFAIVYPGAVDGLPTPDLSQDTIKFALKYKKNDRIYVEKEISNPDTNILTFGLTMDETKELHVGVYECCCKIYYGDEATTVWLQDVMVIKGVLNG